MHVRVCTCVCPVLPQESSRTSGYKWKQVFWIWSEQEADRAFQAVSVGGFVVRPQTGWSLSPARLNGSPRQRSFCPSLAPGPRCSAGWAGPKAGQ